MVLYIVIVPIFLVISLAVAFSLFKLVSVFHDGESLTVRSAKGSSQIPFEDIQKIGRFRYYFFTITYLDKQNKPISIVVMPRMSEFAATFGFRVSGFEDLKNLVRKNNDL
ncbi:MAG TPA: hypothetical protein VIU12_34680 [Chryseolinea sp.]